MGCHLPLSPPGVCPLPVTGEGRGSARTFSLIWNVLEYFLLISPKTLYMNWKSLIIIVDVIVLTFSNSNIFDTFPLAGSHGLVWYNFVLVPVKLLDYVRTPIKKTIKKCNEVYEHIFTLVCITLLLNGTTKRLLVYVEVYEIKSQYITVIFRPSSGRNAFSTCETWFHKLVYIN